MKPDDKRPSIFPKDLQKQAHAGEEIMPIIVLVSLVFAAIMAMEHFTS